jgi:hypothetical protein
MAVVVDNDIPIHFHFASHTLPADIAGFNLSTVSRVDIRTIGRNAYGRVFIKLTRNRHFWNFLVSGGNVRPGLFSANRVGHSLHPKNRLAGI